MAVGDITYDANNPRRQGNVWVATGTLEADTTPRGFAIGGTGIEILTAAVASMDGVSYAQIVLNDSDGTATKGSITVDNSAGTETLNWRVEYQ